MISSYQQQKALDAEERVPEGAQTATIGRVLADGVTLIWDDDGKESKRTFPVNRAIVFRAGDKVKICKVSSTYLVEYPFGAPITTLRADSAVRADSAANADNAASAELAYYATSAGSAQTAQQATNAASADMAKTATSATTCTTAIYLQSNDISSDGIRLTYNTYKKVYAIISKQDSTWRDIALK